MHVGGISRRLTVDVHVKGWVQMMGDRLHGMGTRRRLHAVWRRVVARLYHLRGLEAAAHDGDPVAPRVLELAHRHAWGRRGKACAVVVLVLVSA